MKIRHFQLPGFMSNALARSRLPGFFFFALIVLAAGRLHDKFLLAEPCKCVTVSDVLKYLAADKCNE